MEAPRSEASRESIDTLEPIGGWYTAPLGTQLTFALDGGSAAEFYRPKDGTRQACGGIRFAGTMQVTVVARRDRELIAAVRFPGMNLTGQKRNKEIDARLATLATTLDAAVLVRMDTAGRAAGYRFPEGAGTFAKNHTRTLLGNLLFVLPDDAGTRWMALGANATGRYESEYRRIGRADADTARVSRRRLRYVSVQGASADAVGIRVEGTSSATLSHKIGWLVAAKVEERTLMQPSHYPAELHNRFTVSTKLEQTGSVDLASLPEVDWDGPWSGTSGDPEESAALAREKDEAKWQKALAGMPLRGLVDWFASFPANDSTQDEAFQKAWDHIAWKCRLDPHAIAELCSWIRSGQIDEETAASLLMAMGDAGTPEVQAALATLHGEKSLSMRLRGAATTGLLQAPDPSATAVQTLLRTVQGPGRKEELGNLSLLVLGTLAGRNHAKLPGGKTAYQTLANLEDRARADGNLDTWLIALGNSLSPKTLEYAARYITNDDANLRTAAAIALRTVTADASCDLLVARIANDPAGTVQVRAAQSLVELRTPRAKAALRRLLTTAGSQAVRQALLHGLAGSRKREDVALLRRVAAHDKSESVRQLATQILGSV